MKEKNPWNKTNQWEEELDYLKSILNKTKLQIVTKWGGDVYTINNKNVLGIGGFKSYFGVWFFNGTFLNDEKKVLVSASEKTKGLRQWRFQSKDEIYEKLLLQYINEAIANEEKGLSIKSERNKILPSDFFANELKKDKILSEAFRMFTPFKQKEFIEFVDSAKQEKTKNSRMEKIKPMLLNNIGLNDKYR